jgi:cell shape-determining protein MreD
VPVLGWSTTGGDYRVAHFVGMHALQLIPLAALALTVFARRVPRLRSDTTQVRIVVIISLAYAAGTLLLTLQAAAGQSVVHPSGAVSATVGAILLAAAAATVLALVRRPAPALLPT